MVLALAVVLSSLLVTPSSAFSLCTSHDATTTGIDDRSSSSSRNIVLNMNKFDDEEEDAVTTTTMTTTRTTRRSYLSTMVATTSLLTVMPSIPVRAAQEQEEAPNMFAPSFVQEYNDFTKTTEGWSFRDVSPGDKASDTKVQQGDRVVFDWSGYTIGYFGRPFQAKGGPQGGAFDKDIDYARTVVGSHSIVPGLESALVGMKKGGVKQVVVPYGRLSYPPNDPSHDQVGPKPSTFSGQRALNFVLDNPRVDRTLLFNVKVIRIDKPDGSGGFLRGA